MLISYHNHKKSLIIEKQQSHLFQLFKNILIMQNQHNAKMLSKMKWLLVVLQDVYLAIVIKNNRTLNI